MKCPDCGTMLAEVFLKGVLGHRCFKCGGFWADSKVINDLPEAELATWRRIKIDPMWLSGGKGVCPQDGTMLQNYLGDEVPNYLGSKRCVRCGKWWFGGDSLFEFMAIKSGHQAMYSPIMDIARYSGMVLPVVVGLILLSGLAVGLRLVSHQQQVSVPAYENRISFEVKYLGNGKAAVIFERQVVPVEYREVNDTNWTIDQDGLLEGLVDGLTYEVRVGAVVKTFVAD